jgi:ABC-type dipeptide/oligopeptide/nickel transport system permease subunit
VLDARARARFKRNRAAVAGAVAIGLLVLLGTLGPLVAQHGPLESDFVHGMGPDSMPVGPSVAFPLGTDRLYRDAFARLAYAGRLSLLIAVLATLIASALGALIGIISGWFEGSGARIPWPLLIGVPGAAVALACGYPLVAAGALFAGTGCAASRRFAGPSIDLDGLLMRAVDVMLAFPFLLLVMAIGAALERTSAVTIFLTLGLTGWLGMARVLRAKTIQVRSLDYVEASRALGQSTARLLFKHVLPNIAGTLIVTATVQLAQMIVADSILSYLGVGIPPPTPTWGRMLYEGQDYYLVAPWLVAAPAAAILTAVLGFNMLGEGLRDALDPHETS